MVKGDPFKSESWPLTFGDKKVKAWITWLVSLVPTTSNQLLIHQDQGIIPSTVHNNAPRRNQWSWRDLCWRQIPWFLMARWPTMNGHSSFHPLEGRRNLLWDDPTQQASNSSHWYGSARKGPESYMKLIAKHDFVRFATRPSRTSRPDPGDQPGHWAISELQLDKSAGVDGPKAGRMLPEDKVRACLRGFVNPQVKQEDHPQNKVFHHHSWWETVLRHESRWREDSTRPSKMAINTHPGYYRPCDGCGTTPPFYRWEYRSFPIRCCFPSHRGARIRRWLFNWGWGGALRFAWLAGVVSHGPSL